MQDSVSESRESCADPSKFIEPTIETKEDGQQLETNANPSPGTAPPTIVSKDFVIPALPLDASEKPEPIKELTPVFRVALGRGGASCNSITTGAMGDVNGGEAKCNKLADADIKALYDQNAKRSLKNDATTKIFATRYINAGGSQGPLYYTKFSGELNSAGGNYQEWMWSSTNLVEVEAKELDSSMSMRYPGASFAQQYDHTSPNSHGDIKMGLSLEYLTAPNHAPHAPKYYMNPTPASPSHFDEAGEVVVYIWGYPLGTTHVF